MALRAAETVRQLASARPDRRVARTVFQPLDTTNEVAWSVGSIRSALELHEDGDLRESSRLIRAMGRDERISADLSTRCRALVGKNGSRFSILSADRNPNASGRRKQDKLAREVERWWWSAVPDAVQSRILRAGIMSGVAYGPIRWDTTGGTWTPRIEVWDNEHLWWDSARGALVTQTQQGPQDVIPGTGQWWLYTPDGDDSWMAGAVRALGLAYLMRSMGWRDWARFCERHGMPIIAVQEPASANDTRAFYAQLRDLGSKGVLRLPSAGADEADRYQVSLIEAHDNAWQTFEGFIGRLDTSISICLLGQNLTTEVQGGSYAAAQAHLRVRQDYLDADAESLSTMLREHVVKPWLAFNHGAGDLERAPWPTWDTGMPEDMRAKAETTKVAGEALAAWKSAGVAVDIEAHAERYDVPLAAEQPDPAPPVSDPAPPAVPTEHDEDEDEDDTEPRALDADALHRAARAVLATRASQQADGFVEGQAYVDALTERAVQLGRAALVPDVDQLVALVQDSSSLEEVQRRLVDAYAGLDPSAFAEVVERAMVLAAMAGGYSVVRET